MSLKTVKMKPEIPAYMEHGTQTVCLYCIRITEIVLYWIIVAECPESGYGEPDVCPSDSWYSYRIIAQSMLRENYVK